MARLQKEPTASPRTPSNESLGSSFRDYLYTKRAILCTMSILITIGMVIGMLFVAHYYYHIWGGQGFLKSRTIEDSLDSLFWADESSARESNMKTNSFLPMRKVVTELDDSIFLGHGPVLRRMGPAASPPNNTIPFYVCGDQAQDCEAYGQPNICCPVDFVCHSTTKKITSSGIYCCHYNASSFDCKATIADKPQCLSGSFECSSFTGGGCCPAGSECLNQTTTATTVTTHFPFSTQTKTIGGGCAFYIGNSGGQLLTTTTETTSSARSTSSSTWSTSSSTWSPNYSNIIEQSTTSSVSTFDPDAPTPTGEPAGGSTTATFLGAPIATAVREGEMAVIGAGGGLQNPWEFRTFIDFLASASLESTVVWLLIVAVGFAYL